VVLADAIKVDDLAVEVVQDLHLRRFLSEKHLRSASECLNVRRVLRKYLNDPLRQTVLPTYVR
jgi:hypothetical protein